MKAIFRQVALERLASPERLDELMRVSTPRGWLALLALGALLITAAVWGVYGSVPTKVAGQGMLLKKGGVFQVVAISSGQLFDVSVEVGDVIDQGQEVATISQPELEDKIREAEAYLKEMKRQRDILVDYGQTQLRLDIEALEQERKNTEQDIGVGRRWIAVLEKRIKNQRELFAEGLITESTLLDTVSEHDKAVTENKQNQNKITQIAAQKEQKKQQYEQDMAQANERVQSAEEQLQTLRNTLNLQDKVVSPYSGRVLEVKLDEGQVVKAGQPIVDMEKTGPESRKLLAVGYFPPGEGKTIQKGMEAQISPATIKQEEYGFILGRVVSVSEFPATQEGMMRVLQNADLVRALTQKGPPIEVDVELMVDAKTLSGYKWSSSKGPPITVTSGTLCAATVTTRKQPPVSLVIPLLKKYFLGTGVESSGPS